MAIRVNVHFLVPVHNIIPKEEHTELFTKLRVEDGSKLPQISKVDPAIKKLKPTKGDIVRIERRSHTAGEYTYYRVVK